MLKVGELIYYGRAKGLGHVGDGLRCGGFDCLCLGSLLGHFFLFFCIGGGFGGWCFRLRFRGGNF